MSAIVQRVHNRASEMIVIRDPRTGEDVGSLQEAVPLHVRKAVNASRAALQAWAATPPAERGSSLRAAARALAEAAPELARMNNRETGRPVDEALAGIAAGVSTLEQYAELGPVHRGHSLRGDPLASDYTVAEPRGVAVALTPWNDPVAVACGLIGAALVTGNTVIHKPSERCPHLGAMLGEVLAAAFPPDVLISLTGGSGIGALLTEQTGVDVVAHVGSSAAGARIARASNLTGAHVIRENGGNDPLVVDDDVDPVWAAEQAAVGAFSNNGQICTAVERIYVHRAIAGPFCSALESQARRRNRDGRMAPLVDVRMRDAVHRQVEQALESGARAVEGGSIPGGPGAFYPATVLLDCTADMDIMAEETFGPVAPVQVVDSFNEGLRLAACGRYGLAATVLTGQIAHAQQAIAALPVGTVKVNEVFGGAPGGAAQPRGESGRGFGYGPELLDEFTRVKVVHLAAPPPPAADPATAVPAVRREAP
ncbi:aldehyde dehydrogenase [Arthrobacter sp. ISL-69]|uniref:aldehyde dehydrogenase family protein n=1 Tax=Arthrobacter sp. ISL-69 TaxID=2819113 RepID=UPI001BE9D927|nr:aldehyde dehydrogenase family protein [Arthrobacter sp. ISL-69]MBT2537379.1 aldehyde dehydrogenase family protein [Arthrobacter sp. ISL-69]